jgi:hypothetical protein
MSLTLYIYFSFLSYTVRVLIEILGSIWRTMNRANTMDNRPMLYSRILGFSKMSVDFSRVI